MDVSVALFVITIVFLVVVMPFIVIMHYGTKWKATRGLSTDEQQLLEDLWKKSQAMESRLNSLETILDDEVPDWKRRV
jgi:phage shock protein B